MKNRKIHYEITGSGFPLVFLHGNMEDSTIFSNQIDYFKSKYKLILIDTIMHGKSNNSFSKYSFFDLANDVLNILKNEKIQSANFIGFSDGANILFHIGILKSEIINKGIAISGNINPYGFKFKDLIDVKFKTFYYKLIKNNKYYFYYLMSKNPKLTYKDLNVIKSNFLILAGEHDVIRKKHTIKISENIKNSKLKIINKSDHFALVNDSNTVNKIIESYLL